MVFQRFNLFPHMTALQNVIEAPVHVQRRPPPKRSPKRMQLLDRVGLADKRDAYPAQLSGGQQQRVAIARALAMRPKLMLFDEPTSALDPELVGEVLDVMRDLARAGMTMMVVTHELNFAREVADRVAFMDDGRLVEIGPPAEVLGNPRRPRTHEFIAAVQLLTHRRIPQLKAHIMKTTRKTSDHFERTRSAVAALFAAVTGAADVPDRIRTAGKLVAATNPTIRRSRSRIRRTTRSPGSTSTSAKRWRKSWA